MFSVQFREHSIGHSSLYKRGFLCVTLRLCDRWFGLPSALPGAAPMRSWTQEPMDIQLGPLARW